MNDVLAILKDTGAILEGHFIGNSGRHLSVYVNKDAFLPNTEIVSALCRMTAEAHKDKGIEVVAGPALGGIPLSTWTAHHLSELSGRKVLSVFTEKTSDGGQILKRGYNALVKGKRVLAVEDTITTGNSVQKTVEAVQEAGGEVVQLAIIINRNPKHITSETFGVPLSSLAEFPSESYAETEVPDWLRAIPVSTEYGHGAEYIREHPNVKLL